MSASLLAVLIAATALVAFAITWFFAKRQQAEREAQAATTARALLDAARAESETIKRDAQIEAKETIFRAKQEAEREAKLHREELAKHDEALAQREVNVEKKAA